MGSVDFRILGTYQNVIESAAFDKCLESVNLWDEQDF